ncbi:MAG: hypothetical protein HPM95_07430 [Alphaproteobacteria bacterium]|nr:hypothetical protein [Alphaproteobacteria bacterium]
MPATGSAALEALSEGQTETDSFLVTSADGTATTTVTITVTGENDAAGIGGKASDSFDEDDAATLSERLPSPTSTPARPASSRRPMSPAPMASSQSPPQAPGPMCPPPARPHLKR